MHFSKERRVKLRRFKLSTEKQTYKRLVEAQKKVDRIFAQLGEIKEFEDMTAADFSNQVKLADQLLVAMKKNNLAWGKWMKSLPDHYEE